jgi:hypothetical protein
MAREDSPWRPASLRDREDLEAFAYVVVEERIDDTFGLVVAEWPSGGRGAPRFEEQSEFELAVDSEALQRQVSDRQVPEREELSDEITEELRRRRVEVGDAFAVRPAWDDLPPEEDLEGLRTCEWMGETIDVTADAREAAKAKMYEALTPPLDPHLAERLRAGPEQATEPGEPAA